MGEYGTVPVGSGTASRASMGVLTAQRMDAQDSMHGGIRGGSAGVQTADIWRSFTASLSEGAWRMHRDRTRMGEYDGQSRVHGMNGSWETHLDAKFPL